MRFFFFLIFCLISSLVLAQNATLLPEKPIYDLRLYSQIFHDSSQKMTIEQMMEAKQLFKNYDKNLIKREKGVYWLKFSIKSTDKQTKKWTIGMDGVDQIKLFVVDLNDSILQTDESNFATPVLQRNDPHGQYTFTKFSLNPNQNLVCYLRFQLSTQFAAEMMGAYMEKFKLYSEQSYQENFVDFRFYMALYYGAIFIMLLYNLSIGIFLKDRGYFLYVLYLCSLSLFVAGQSGYILEMLPNCSDFVRDLRFVAAIMFIVSYYFFSKHYLKTAFYVPKMDKVFNIFIALFLLDTCLLFFGQYHLFRIFGYSLAIFAFFLPFVTSVLCYRKGYAPAIFYLIASTMILTNNICYVMYSLSIIPQTPTTKIIEYLLPITSVLEIALFSLGLANKFELVKKELVENKLRQEQEKQIYIEQKNRDLEYQVKLRTAELIEKNEELNQIVEELDSSNENLKIVNQEIFFQKEAIEEQNLKITDSIRYAKTIQQAILPKDSEFRLCFSDFFVIFLPKDIVSGDFYWFSHIPNENPNSALTFIAVIDCTGHGVPGAFMSMIGHTLLEEIINVKEIFDPAKALNKMNSEIRKLLKQEEKQNVDGMDIGLCKIENVENQERKVTYSGAKRPLLYAKNGVIDEIRGVNKSVGGQAKRNDIDFVNETLYLSVNDLLILKTDGWVDQPNPSKERYGRVRIKSFIQDHLQEDMADLKKNILQSIQNFTEKEAQRDDITILGLRI